MVSVVSMRRIRLGGVAMSKLPLGQWRYLSSKEKFIFSWSKNIIFFKFETAFFHDQIKSPMNNRENLFFVTF